MPAPSAEATAGNHARQAILRRRAAETTKDAHGSAHFAEPEELEALGLYREDAPLIAGRSATGEFIRYGGSGHGLCLGPNDSGKGTSVIIPTLLTYPASVVSVDPKGALAAVTMRRRIEMGQRVILIDPFGEVKGYAFDRCRASFNPLSILDPDLPTLIDDLRLISSSLVISENDRNRFFSDTARTVLETLILYMLAEYDPQHWTVGTMVDLAYQSPEQFAKQLLPKMAQSTAFNGLLRQLGNQLAGFSGEAGANVFMTLRRSLNFLQSPLISAALRPSGIDFATLKDLPTTVYLVLPATHLEAYGRWLRLMLSVILNSILDPRRPAHPVLFLLDEAAALDRLEMIESGIALFRGYSIKLFLIWQDLAQLQSVYKDRWSTFIANSGLRQVFNVNDLTTADYFSRFLGQETRPVLSESLQPGQIPGSGSVGVVGRPLMTPDEIAQMPGDEQLVLIDRMPPIRCRKLCYYDGATDPEFAGLFDPDPYI